jgi:hypothetical protein
MMAIATGRRQPPSTGFSVRLDRGAHTAGSIKVAPVYEPGPYTSTSVIASFLADPRQIPFTSHEGNGFSGTVGIGPYLMPHIKGDSTFDWRHDQSNKFTGSYTLPLRANAADTVNGTVSPPAALMASWME